MTDREVRKLGKLQLLQIIRNQEIELLELQEKVDELQRQLDDRRLIMEHAGSIAEAALQINGVMEAAQRAADQYLASVQHIAIRMGTVTEESEKYAKDD